MLQMTRGCCLAGGAPCWSDQRGRSLGEEAGGSSRLGATPAWPGWPFCLRSPPRWHYLSLANIHASCMLWGGNGWEKNEKTAR